jgi:hypothetical protein
MAQATNVTRSMPRFASAALAALCVLLAIEILLFTGLIRGWGVWYSSSLAYRRQTDAYLRGELALSHSPTQIGHDLAWGPSGVQQNWGLVGPFWRLPFECLARIVGQPAFPDRISLGLFIALTGYVAARGIVDAKGSNLREWRDSALASPLRIAAAVLVVLFPPILNVCSGPFNVYEEAVVYGYFYSIALLGGTLLFCRNPNVPGYIALGLLSGLAGFVRPTTIFYGLATVIVISVIARRRAWTLRRTALAPLAFCVGGAALFLANWVRYGSGFEFGHRVNVSATDNVYHTRFHTVFLDEPLLSAAGELLGSLFFVKELNGFDVHREGILWLQSQTPRWRHFYTSTFDFTYLALLGAGAVIAVTRRGSAQNRSATRDILVCVSWSLIIFVPLSAFYLRNMSMSSRYVLDFAGGVAAAIVGVLIWASSQTAGSFRRNLGVVGLLVVWWAWQVSSAEQYFPPTSVLTNAELIKAMNQPRAAEPVLPDSYDAESIALDYLGIPGNCHGWKPGSGETEAAVTLFVRDPEWLVLNLAPAEGQQLAESDFRTIQARIGSELVDIESLSKTADGWRLQFMAPTNSAFRRGVQFVSLAFSGPADPGARRSPFVLRRVAWR